VVVEESAQSDCRAAQARGLTSGSTISLRAKAAVGQAPLESPELAIAGQDRKGTRSARRVLEGGHTCKHVKNRWEWVGFGRQAGVAGVGANAGFGGGTRASDGSHEQIDVSRDCGDPALSNLLKNKDESIFALCSQVLNKTISLFIFIFIFVLIFIFNPFAIVERRIKCRK
jgi:hypothetical protein